MNVPRGQVVSINGDDRHRYALVDVDVSQACPRCASGKGCGAGIFSGRAPTRRVEASVPAGTALEVGDTVGLALAPQNVLLAACTVYGVPLLGAAVGVTLAYAFGFGESGAAVSALAGLAAGFWTARWRLSRRCIDQFMPRVIN